MAGCSPIESHDYVGLEPSGMRDRKPHGSSGSSMKRGGSFYEAFDLEMVQNVPQLRPWRWRKRQVSTSNIVKGGVARRNTRGFSCWQSAQISEDFEDLWGPNVEKPPWCVTPGHPLRSRVGGLLCGGAAEFGEICWSLFLEISRYFIAIQCISYINIIVYYSIYNMSIVC